jgi:hypothetical protein
MIVLFGGKDANGFNDETWTWDGNNWRLQHPMHAPSARNQHAMTYYHDGTRGSVVLFGGTDADGHNNETWIWNGYDWIQIHENGPLARTGHTMVYDKQHELVVLFGGKTGGSYSAETWGFTTEVPFEQTELEINISQKEMIIRNSGDADAYDISWTMNNTGGIFGGIDQHLYGNIEILPSGDEVKVALPFLIGLGRLQIEASVGSINTELYTTSVKGIIFLFFIFLF